MFRSCSGNIQEQQLRKPGKNGGSFLRRSLPRSGVFFSTLWSTQQPRDRRPPSHGDRNYRRSSPQPSHDDRNSGRDSLLLSYYFVRQTKEGALHKSAKISQWEYPTTREADQIWLALQQLATNFNSANFNNNISRISKLPKSLTTTMPTFDGKTEKFELFEDLFQARLKIHNQLTEEDKINYFHSLMRGDALQTFKNITSPNRENLREILTVFRKKYVKPQSMATAKHKFQRLVFNPANQKLFDFLDELQKLAKDAFGVAAQAIIE